MDAKLAVILVVGVVLVLGATALGVGEATPNGIQPPDGHCEVACARAYHRCWAACQGQRDDPLCEAACLTTWEICQWQCQVTPLLTEP